MILINTNVIIIKNRTRESCLSLSAENDSKFNGILALLSDRPVIRIVVVIIL